MSAPPVDSEAPRRFPAPSREPRIRLRQSDFGPGVLGPDHHADTGQVMDLSPSPGYDFSEPLLDQDALATWLNVSVSSVKKWTQSGPESGRIPRFYRVNGVVRFRHVDVQAWMEGRAVG